MKPLFILMLMLLFVKADSDMALFDIDHKDGYFAGLHFKGSNFAGEDVVITAPKVGLYLGENFFIGASKIVSGGKVAEKNPTYLVPTKYTLAYESLLFGFSFETGTFADIVFEVEAGAGSLNSATVRSFHTFVEPSLIIRTFLTQSITFDLGISHRYLESDNLTELGLTYDQVSTPSINIGVTLLTR
jgi:hypothetical protein